MISLRTRLHARDRIFFAKQLSVLMAADVPLSEGLAILRDQNHSRGLSFMLESVLRDVRNGKSLARSLGRYRSPFGEFAIGVIAIGEASGTLGQNLEYLAYELKKRQALKRKIVGALLYPALITLATLVLTGFLVLYLFPKLMPVFLSLEMQLPLSTRIVMGTSQFLTRYGWILILFAIIVVVLAEVARKRYSRVDRALARLFLHMPLVRTFIQRYYIAQSMRSLGLLMKSGMPLSSALFTLSELTRNPLYKTAWEEIGSDVNRGELISDGLKSRPQLFSSLAVNMVAVGERGGDLPRSFIYIAEAHESELDEQAKSFSTILEPALMICMGILIGTVAISIITPIYGLTQHLQS